MFKGINTKLSLNVAALIGLLCVFLYGLYFFVELSVDKLDSPQAYRYYDRNDELLCVLISRDEFFRMRTPLEKVDPLFIKTLLLQEDQYFYQHPGVNPISIIRAALANLQNGRVVSGASTLTMQLARMLDRQDRTLFNKIVETIKALKLESLYSKNEILEHYLSLAPYGGNLEGLLAATYAYLGKSAQNLSAGEVALLVSIPQSPNYFRPDKKPRNAELARNAVLLNMRNEGLIDQKQYLLALSEPIPTHRKSFPNIIPHTAWFLKAKYPTVYTHNLTIDFNTQSRVNKLLKNYVEALSDQQINNASAVVLDSVSHEVLALVGSRGYFHKKSLGANDGVRLARSPGSTLKPFMYALALDDGLISEKTMLHDIPINYGGYSPQNYSKEFRGLVTVREALTDSLNVVAVRLSKEAGYKKLYQLLKDSGVSSINEPPSHYGLPLVLGGVEVNLLELTNLYAMLANAGEYKPYYMFMDKGDQETSSKKLISDEAAWIITDILTDVERPDFPSSWRFSKSRPTLAWKTGTSYGHQDAWSVGYTPEVSVGVWVGNFDATPAAGLSGSSAAAPLLFDIIQAVDFDKQRWFSKPEGVGVRKVCALCGRPGNRYCKNDLKEFYIKNKNEVKANTICDINQLIVIDRVSGEQASSDTNFSQREKKIFSIWPSELAQFLLLHGVPVRNAPAYDISNMAGQKYFAPVILSPIKNTLYIKRRGLAISGSEAIKLKVAVTNRVRTIRWYMDGELIHKGDPINDFFINPSPGKYLLEAIDETGGKDSVLLEVKDYREIDGST